MPDVIKGKASCWPIQEELNDNPYVEAPENSRIIECVKAGTFYVAEILELEGAVCNVKIHAPQL